MDVRFAKAAVGGGGGIRTPGTVSGTPDFESPVSR